MIYHQLPPLDDRIRLLKRSQEEEESRVAVDKLSNNKIMSIEEEVRKVLKAAQLERVRRTLRGMDKSCISYSEFVDICAGDQQHHHHHHHHHHHRHGTADADADADGNNRAAAMEAARVLDQSGDVIVLGNLVFLHPHQVARRIESVIPLSSLIQTTNNPISDDDPRRRRKELEAMEEKKAEIEKKAKELAKRESWCGLGLFLAQQIGFMRLTFWELSWDVMEPICFFVTSLYFMAGYAFFLRTTTEPSFEAIFRARVAAKRKRLMRTEDFDVNKFYELKRAFK